MTTALEGSEADLVARLRGRDEAAFAAVLDAWSASMLRLARAIVSTDASAAEVVQEAWTSVVRAIDGFEGRSSLRTWVYRILVNAAKRRAMQERRSVPWSSLMLDDEPTVDPDAFQGRDEPWPGHWRSPPEPWPEQALLAGEVRAVVAAAVARLPAQQQAVVTLRDVEGWTGPETSELLGLTEGNQRVLLHRARARLRRELDDYLQDQRRPGSRPGADGGTER